ncbi:MAG TPA: hypothetical protein VD887_01610 [Allosphingosinicella sp.]|nr:hypothetical protein [Allosphingosinicella sp.]
MQFENRNFEGGTVNLDGNRYTGCTFRNTVLRFGGGDLHMTDCEFDGISFQFEGKLANGLHALYQLFGTEGLIKIIRGFVDPQPGVMEL